MNTISEIIASQAANRRQGADYMHWAATVVNGSRVEHTTDVVDEEPFRDLAELAEVLSNEHDIRVVHIGRDSVIAVHTLNEGDGQFEETVEHWLEVIED